jgi:hypothetical protein
VCCASKLTILVIATNVLLHRNLWIP